MSFQLEACAQTIMGEFAVDKLPGHRSRGTAIAVSRSNRMNCDPNRPDTPPTTSIKCVGRNGADDGGSWELEVACIMAWLQPGQIHNVESNNDSRNSTAAVPHREGIQCRVQGSIVMGLIFLGKDTNPKKISDLATT
jgi:hypothetical protein